MWRPRSTSAQARGEVYGSSIPLGRDASSEHEPEEACMGEAMPAMDRLAECGPVHGQLGALLLVQETLHELLQLVVTSIGSYRETYGASVTARRGDSFYTPNASSGRVRDLDTTQYETNDGPSVSATMTGTEVNLGLEEVRAR